MYIYIYIDRCMDIGKDILWIYRYIDICIRIDVQTWIKIFMDV